MMNTNTKTDTKTVKGEQTSRLSDIEVQEVSMVDKGANRRRWACVKSAGSREETQTLLDRFHSAKAGDVDALKTILKELLLQLSDDVLKELGLQRLEAAPAEPPAEGGEPPAEGGEVEASAEQQKVADLEAKLEKMNAELVEAKKRLQQVGEPQSGGEPRRVTPVGKSASEEPFKTLGCRPLNK